MTIFNNDIRYRIVVEDIRFGTAFTPYTNATFGISAGTWTIESTGDLLTGLDNAIQKINISKGGNYATGYSFGFEISNFDFVKDILADGVFFKNLKTILFIDIGAGFVQEWTGIIDTFTLVSETQVKWKCTDPAKSRNEKMGSDEVPIALNRNYNCKLALTQKLQSTFFSQLLGTEIILDNTLSGIDEETSSFLCRIHTSGTWDTGILNDFNDGVMEITMGGGSGTIYQLISTEFEAFDGLGREIFRFFVNGDVSQLITAAAKVDFSGNLDVSLVRITFYQNLYNLSNNAVKQIHVNRTSFVEKPFELTNDVKTIILTSPDDYDDQIAAEGYQQILLKGLDQNETIRTFSFTALNQTIVTEVKFNTEILIGQNKLTFVVEYLLNVQDRDNLTSLFDESDDDVKLDFGKLTAINALSGAGSVNPDVKIQFSMVGNYKTAVHFNAFSQIVFVDKDMVIVSENGNDLEFDFNIQFKRTKDDWTISNYFNDDSLANVTISITGTLFYNDDHVFQPSSWTVENAGFRSLNEFKAQNRSIGCAGENVQPFKNFQSVGETLEYIQEIYGNIDSADINDASYDQADEDFDLFPSATFRNPCHQIIAQTDVNTVLRDVLYNNHLGMYFGRNGQYFLKNWLPESTVFFNNVLPIASFTDQNFMSISNIKRDNINNITSDFELHYDFNESTGEFQKEIRIKNTSEATFDFARDVEGVVPFNSKIAEEAWLLLSAGFKRIRKESQTTMNTKWIKSFFSTGIGDGEAISFIRNQAGHVNREHEYLTITIPLSSTNLSLELLSFLSVRDLKVTGNVERLGWIVERKINTKSDLLELTLLLDISATDPFLVEIGVLQDAEDQVGNEFVDDSTAPNEIVDGDGK